MHLIDLARWFSRLCPHTRLCGNLLGPVDINSFYLLRTARNQTAFLHASCTGGKTRSVLRSGKRASSKSLGWVAAMERAPVLLPDDAGDGPRHDLRVPSLTTPGVVVSLRRGH